MSALRGVRPCAAPPAALLPGAKDITIYETPNPAFEIVAIDTPNFGPVQEMPDGSLQWYIDELAVSEQQTATLRFTLKDRCKKTGKMPVNKSVCLVDEAQESPAFPNPMITVTKDVCEDCPEAVEVTAPACVDSICADLGGVCVPDMGRMLTVSIKLYCVTETITRRVHQSSLHRSAYPKIYRQCQNGYPRLSRQHLTGGIRRTVIHHHKRRFRLTPAQRIKHPAYARRLIVAGNDYTDFSATHLSPSPLYFSTVTTSECGCSTFSTSPRFNRRFTISSSSV